MEHAESSGSQKEEDYGFFTQYDQPRDSEYGAPSQ